MWGFFLTGCHEVIQVGHHTEAGNVSASYLPNLTTHCLATSLYLVPSLASLICEFVSHSGSPLCQCGVSSHQGFISFSPHSVTVLSEKMSCVISPTSANHLTSKTPLPKSLEI